MTKYAAIVEYDGTAYHGWQLQNELPTVQGALEQALVRILGASTRVYGAGRTDAGVHASGQVAHFVADWRHSEHSLLKACNALLPPDVTVIQIHRAPESFHARHSARAKTYVYSFLTRPIRSSVSRQYLWHVPRPVDVAAMKEASAHLLGAHDFAAFGAPTDGTPSTVRQIFRSDWEIVEEHVLRFIIKGSGFLRYMVRSIVGTLVLVGYGKISPSDFLRILESKERSKAGPTAPPHGLSLVSVEYDRPFDVTVERIENSV
jgi:tRNA pseudouridine38-40 synthase